MAEYQDLDGRRRGAPIRRDSGSLGHKPGRALVSDGGRPRDRVSDAQAPRLQTARDLGDPGEYAASRR